MCNLKGLVQENCPLSCGICGPLGNEEICFNVDGKFTLGKGQWARQRSCAKAASKQKLCSKWKIKKLCPQACGLCTLNSAVIPTASPTASPTGFKCNGLESNCDMRVNEILYATVHNANHDDTPLQNHNKELEYALVAGYRGLMLDVCMCDNELIFCHEYCWLGVRDPKTVFENIATFLDSNPGEVLIINFEMSEGDPTPADLWTVMDAVDGFGDRMYQKTSAGGLWPTLGQMVEFDSRIIAFQHNYALDCPGSSGCTSKIYDFFDYAMETDWVRMPYACCSIPCMNLGQISHLFPVVSRILTM